MAAPLPISRSFSSEFHVVQDGYKCSSSAPIINISMKNISLLPSKDNNSTKLRTKMNKKHYFSREDDHGKRCNQCFQASRTEGSLCRKVLSPIFYASESDFTEKHKSSPELYSEKLQSQEKQASQFYATDVSDADDQTSQLSARKELRLLEKYFKSVKEDGKSEDCLLSFPDRNASGKSEDSISMNQFKGMAIQEFQKSTNIARKAASFPMYDEKESGNLYLISTLLSINIAVFLFEIASPVKDSDYNLYSLPLIYGSKVNDLIMVGEWWRLVTPMFLHSGLLHIALGSWVLLSFGPRVCKGYGSFTFALIFILGGISGNLSSFLHTSEATVGGSGPVFAVIGAWLVYQIQNKDVIAKELSDSMFQKAIIATALSFLLGEFGPVDNWTSLGAAVSGIIYGYFTSPVVQLDDAPASSMQERNSEMKEEITLNSTQAAKPLLGGNAATNYMLMFALLAGTTGIASVGAGFAHFRSWSVASMAAATSAAVISWAFTGLAFGLAWKEVRLGGYRGKRLQTLEVFIITSTLIHLLYIILLYAGHFNHRYGLCHGGPGPDASTREAQKTTESEPPPAA